MKNGRGTRFYQQVSISQKDSPCLKWSVVELSSPLPQVLVCRLTASSLRETEDNVMAYAIFKTGSKQYKVSVGDKIDVEKLTVNEGEWATFDQVLAHGEGSQIQVGAPTVSGATVVAKVVKQHRAPKVTSFKFRRRKGYHLTRGHRQHLTRVQIVSING